MNRVYNFSAGPSMLPLEVLEKAQKELVCYGNSGMSVMEMSHRSADFENILNTAKADLKELMNVPDDYEILFVQGGGSTQFAMVPLNLFANTGKADFIKTGQWAKKAMEEAGRYGKVRAVASSEDKTYTYDAKGRLISVVDGKGATRTFTYGITDVDSNLAENAQRWSSTGVLKAYTPAVTPVILG